MVLLRGSARALAVLVLAVFGTSIFLAAISATASAEPIPGRSVLVIHGPPAIPPGMTLTIELDGRPLPREAFETPMIVQPGPRLLRISVLDAAGAPVLEPIDQLVRVAPGSMNEVALQGVRSEADSGLIAGGVAVTGLGALFGVGSVLSFIVADAAGFDCHESGFAKDACGAAPEPWLGMGIAGLLFGIGGLVGGPIMIATGAEKKPIWLSPTASETTATLSLGLSF